jgi:hypothetical protein
VDASTESVVHPHSFVGEEHYNTCLDILAVMTQKEAEQVFRAAEVLRNFSDDGIEPQSGEEEEAHQVLSLIDATPEQTVDIPSEMDPTRSFADKSDNTLGEFLQRPLKIGEFVWTPSVSFYESFNPWELFINNKRNVNRMNNFRMFRSKLKIKILINGNSFFYGRLMASYQPLADYDELTANAALIPQDNVQMSQFPRFFIDPTTSQGGEMTLPFMWFYDYCNLVNEDYLALGKMTIRELTPLKHTSGDVTLNNQLNVTVYAWMEDVQLEAPTAANMGAIVPQSGFDRIIPHMGKDERDRATKGPVEKVATAVEAAAKTLATIPQIAPFATPAAIGASAVKGVASTMGWCSPSIIDPPVNYRPMPTANTAVTNGADSSLKLTMDGKQELSVDPRIVGLGSQDELDIKYIASRESYLTSFDWGQTTAAETLLWNSRVDPCICDRATVSGKTTYFFPAMCGAALPFKYWNGSLKFRFQVVASAFHRGRLAIVYDPQSTASTREDNVAYTQIVDIATSRDFTVTIGANQDKTMIARLDPDGATSFGTSPLGSSSLGNGTIAVYVLNELSLPSADTTVNNDIKVNVFVCADNDIEFFMPEDKFTEFVIKPQSGKDEGSTINPDEVQVSEDYDPDEKKLAVSTPINLRNLVYAGEQILSFRQLLKRYYPWRGIYMPQNMGTATSVWKFEHCSIPGYRGNVNGAIDTRATGTIPYSYVSTTLLNYLLPAFQAARGSVRWKIARRGASTYDTTSQCATVSFSYDGRYNDQHFSYGTTTNDVARATTVDPGAIKHEYAALGTVVYAPSANPVIEYEVPWYTQERFLPGKQQNFTTQANVEGFPRPGVEVLMDDGGAAAFFMQTYCAAGEDFSMYFFTGWPRMYHESVLPAV